MTIYLFGDSYVEAEPAEPLNVKDHKRWYDLLSEMMKESHKNLGKCGEGPTSTFSKFRKMFERGTLFNEDDKFVFVLSSPYRIPWRWNFYDREYVEDDYICHSSTIFQDFFSNGRRNTDLKFDKYQIYTLKSFYDTMYDELSYTNMKNICFLKHISSQKNWPMIVFTVFDINRDNPKQKKYNQDIYDLEYLNDDLFYFYPIPLYTHSRNEWINVGDLNQGMLNHFSERNHQILANVMCNHFTGSEHNTKFHEKFIKGDMNRDSRFNNDKTTFVDFVYE